MSAEFFCLLFGSCSLKQAYFALLEGSSRKRERTHRLVKRETDTDDLFIKAIAPHEGVRVDDLPPHSAYSNCAYERENKQTNDDVLDYRY